jgi:hypothetical protein
MRFVIGAHASFAAAVGKLFSSTTPVGSKMLGKPAGVAAVVSPQGPPSRLWPNRV